ncbi:FkbM family methyltransferase [Haloplanus sp. GCM10025708]
MEQRELSLVDVELPDGAKREMYFVDPSYQLNEQRKQKYYEPILTEELFDQFSSDSVFYDIGSYFGYYSQLASYSGVPAENIFAFEADSTRYEFLEEVHGNDGVRTVNAFVGNETSSNGIRLDNFVSTNPHPSIIKIDVEGGEFDVLQGMRDTIGSARPILYIELHPQVYSNFGVSVDDIITLLHENDYQIWMANHRDGSTWEEASLEALPKYNPETEDTNTPENTYLIKADTQ